MPRAGRVVNNGGRALWNLRRPSVLKPWRTCLTITKTLAENRWFAVIFLLIGSVSLYHQIQRRPQNFTLQGVRSNLWSAAPSLGWQSSCAQRSSNWFPPLRSNGYLVVRCNGGLATQRTAICNAVVAARILNATLVLPHLDSNSFLPDENGFSGIYDVDHFIKSLKNDVRVARSLPAFWSKENQKIKLRPFKLHPPRNATVDWYETVALEKLLEHGAIYLSPFSHHLAEELDNMPEYQRLRCRVNYHALKFTEDVRNLSSIVVERLREHGPYLSIHLRFEMDMLAYAGCYDIFNATEQEILKKYRKENFADKELEYTRRRLIGKCPLTPKEVGLFLLALGFNSSTRIYLAVGDIFGGDRFLEPLRTLFPLIETRLTVAGPTELSLVNSERRGFLGPAIDYMVCLLSEIFIPTYHGPSNFANNLIGQRLYYGFRTTLLPDRRALAPLLIGLEEGSLEYPTFQASVKDFMSKKSTGSPQVRVPRVSIYSNPWPECFCSVSATKAIHRCPSRAAGIPNDDDYQDDAFSYWEDI